MLLYNKTYSCSSKGFTFTAYIQRSISNTQLIICHSEDLIQNNSRKSIKICRTTSVKLTINFIYSTRVSFFNYTTAYRRVFPLKYKKNKFISTELMPNQFNELQNIVHGQLDSLSDPFVLK